MCLPFDCKFKLRRVDRISTRDGVNDEAVNKGGLELLQYLLDVMSLVWRCPIESVVRPNTDVVEEIPRDDDGLISASKLMERLSQSDTLRAMRRIKPVNAVVQTRFNDCALRILGRTRFVSELADEAVAAKNKRDVIFERRGPAVVGPFVGSFGISCSRLRRSSVFG